MWVYHIRTLLGHNRKRLRIKGSGKHPNYQMMPLSKTVILYLLGCVLMTTTALAVSCTSQGYIIDQAHYVPRNQKEYTELTKDMKCSPPNLNVTYLINTWRNETIVGCFCDFNISEGYCAELNIGSQLRVQPNFAASCRNFTVTPCKLRYNSAESYLIHECFEKFGNIPSPRELFLQNENIRRIENDQKIVIKKQNLSLSEQIRKNMELASELKEMRNFTEKQNMTIAELTTNKLKCENTGPIIAYCLLSFVLVFIVGHILLFVIHKIKCRDITFCQFWLCRLMLLKAWVSTSGYQLSPSVSATNSEQEQLREDGNNEVTSLGNNTNDRTQPIHVENTQSTAIENSCQRENLDTTASKNENETSDKAEMTDRYHQEDELNGKNELLPIENRDTNDVEPERRQSEGEQSVSLKNFKSNRIRRNKMLSNMEHNRKVYSKDREPKETIMSNIKNMEEIDKAEVAVVDVYLGE